MRSWWTILALLPMLILGASGARRTSDCKTTMPSCAMAVQEETPPEEIESCCSMNMLQEEAVPSAEDAGSCCANSTLQDEVVPLPAKKCCASNQTEVISRNCCGRTPPLSSLIFCCLTPLTSVPSPAGFVLVKPSLSAFVLPIWEISPQVHAQRTWQSRPVFANTGPPPSRSSLCVWVI